RGHERARQKVALARIQPLDGLDGAAGRARCRHRAGHFRHAIDQGQAAAALPLRLAAILGRQDPAAQAQGLKQTLVVRTLELYRLAIEREGKLHFTIRPRTITRAIPTGGRVGSANVARSSIVAGSKTTRSADCPGAITPPASPSAEAACEVILRTASSRGRRPFSRT